MNSDQKPKARSTVPTLRAFYFIKNIRALCLQVQLQTMVTKLKIALQMHLMWTHQMTDSPPYFDYFPNLQ